VETDIPTTDQSKPGGPDADTSLYENTFIVFPWMTTDPGQYHAPPELGTSSGLPKVGVRQLPLCCTMSLCTFPRFDTELSGLAVPVVVSDIHHRVRPSGTWTGTKPSAVTQPVPARPRFSKEL
jgi:hypothetical protein